MSRNDTHTLQVLASPRANIFYVCCWLLQILGRKRETDFYKTPPVLGGAALFDSSVPAVFSKILCPKNPEFITPLGLNCQKERRHLALEVYENQSPSKVSAE